MSHLSKLARKYAAPAVVVLGFGASSAFAAVDADITAGLADIVLTWTAVKAVIIPVGVFLIGYSYFKRVRSA